MPFPLNSANQKLALPVLGPNGGSWKVGLAPDRLVVSEGLEGLSAQMEVTLAGGS
jgi:hypothetical protein